jgi:hypothetical protein
VKSERLDNSSTAALTLRVSRVIVHSFGTGISILTPRTKLEPHKTLAGKALPLSESPKWE